jgi:hypothetical protein
MSEFSESYHLRGTSRRDALELLARAGLGGFVFPALDGWVTFVAEGKPFVPNKKLIKANTGTLLRWICGDDHGWGFDVFHTAKRVCKYFCLWEEEIAVDGRVSHAQLSEALGMQLIGLAGRAGRQILYPDSIAQVAEVKPAYAFAQAVGLTHYRWLAFDYLQADAAQGRPLPPGVQRVE